MCFCQCESVVHNSAYATSSVAQAELSQVIAERYPELRVWSIMLDWKTVANRVVKDANECEGDLYGSCVLNLGLKLKFFSTAEIYPAIHFLPFIWDCPVGATVWPITALYGGHRGVPRSAETFNLSFSQQDLSETLARTIITGSFWCRRAPTLPKSEPRHPS